ncbi:hypothetical protein [Ureibacillus terrenus]|uniref:Uncharacterized protein n=1 Tax=Ureibacillus terrenus TaxID=118246 RepID=A0A540V579_9BACL|nr:hypothetical protein [Ureibacillus terrenus]TQE91901.1 hypothetical protein FKZ59_02040 [Ureibacillus terrenus]
MSIVAMGSAIFVMFILSQAFLYMQEKRKEKSREYKEIAQNYILPYLNEVFLFIDLKTDVRNETGVPMITISPDEIITNLQIRIRYGDAKIMNALYRYFNAAAYFEGRGEAKNLATYDVFFRYLEHAYNSIEKSEFKDDQLLDDVLKCQKIYGMAFVLTMILGNDEALKVLSYRWLWSENFLNKISIYLLEDLINNYNKATMEEHKLLEFLRILKKDFHMSPEIDRFQELKNYLEEAFFIVEKRWLNYSS